MNGPSGDWPEELDDRFAVEVGTASGTPATVEFRVHPDRHPDVVEVWFQERCRAVLNRRLLRDWLAEPRGPLVVGGVAFSLEQMVDAKGRGALDVPGVLVWTLTTPARARLRAHF